MRQTHQQAGQDLESILDDAAERACLSFEEEQMHMSSPVLEYYSFPQVWPSTSRMSGGPGGQMITSAQTTVVIISDIYYVYCDGDYMYSLSSAEAGSYLQEFNFPSKRAIEEN